MALHPPTVGEFVHEFVTHNVALEGALWRTLHALLIRPGLLTTEYFAGRRARYIAPLRLYLTFSLILFALNSTSGENLRVGGVFQIGVAKEGGTGAIDLRPDKFKGTGIEPVDRLVRRVASLSPEARRARIASSVKQFVPYVLIAVVPVLALYLKLLYWNRHRLYGEHLVVALHAQTAAFVFGIVIASLPEARWSDGVDAIAIGLVVFQGVIALGRVYGGRLPVTIARTAVLFTTYIATAALAIAALTFASLAA